MKKLLSGFFLLRPWSLTATLVPFLVALPFFLGDPRDCHRFNHRLLAQWGIALVAGIFLQLACNLLNTWGDDRSGVDAVPGTHVTTPQIQQGLVTPVQVLSAAFFCLAVTGGLGALLCFDVFGSHVFNWPLLIVSVLGFLGATNYATGLKFKYHGLGVPFVFILMGPLYFCGICSVLNASVAAQFVTHPGRCLMPALAVSLVSLPVACLVAVILHGNDMRDMASDRAAGIKTTATVLGPQGALILYYVLHLVPYAFVFVLGLLGAPSCPWSLVLLLPCLALPLTIRTLRQATRVYRSNPAQPPWMRLERASGAIHFLFGVLYALTIDLVLRITG